MFGWVGLGLPPKFASWLKTDAISRGYDVCTIQPECSESASPPCSAAYEYSCLTGKESSIHRNRHIEVLNAGKTGKMAIDGAIPPCIRTTPDNGTGLVKGRWTQSGLASPSVSLFFLLHKWYRANTLFVAFRICLLIASASLYLI